MEYLRNLGNYLTAAQLVPISPVARNDWDDYCAFLETLDFSRCTHAGPFSLLHGYVLAMKKFESKS